MKGEEDEEEQLHHRQRIRTTPYRPSPTAEVEAARSPSPIASSNISSGPSLSLEIRESELPAPTLENVGASWIHPGFVMPTKEEALRSLVIEI